MRKVVQLAVLQRGMRDEVMKILLLADHEEKILWDDWSEETAEQFSDIDLILSAGDLDADYLEFLVTMLNVPLVYVNGNHDESYQKAPPQGCIDADGTIVEIRCGNPLEKIRILGLGGSMRYNDDAPYMYTEKEMKRRIFGIRKTILKNKIQGKLKGQGTFEIFLTHSPCKGYGDLDDLPHQGFACFNDLLNRYRPALHVYGHTHRAYGSAGTEGTAAGAGIKGFRRKIKHPSGTTLINADSYFVLDTANL